MSDQHSHAYSGLGFDSECCVVDLSYSVAEGECFSEFSLYMKELCRRW